MGEYVIYDTNLPENPERKGNAQFSYLGVVLVYIYSYKVSAQSSFIVLRIWQVPLSWWGQKSIQDHIN